MDIPLPNQPDESLPPAPGAPAPGERLLRAMVACATAATLLTIAIVASGALPFGAPSVWTWLYAPIEAPGRLLFGLIPLALAAAVVLGPGRALLGRGAPTRRQEGIALAALWLMAFASANAIVLMHPSGWAHTATLVVNPASNSYFSTALRHRDLAALLRDYPRQMPGLASHAQTQSAGPVVFSSVAARLASASPLTPALADTLLALSPGTTAEVVANICRRWEPNTSPDDVRAALCVGLLMIGVGSLAVVPIYLLGKWLDAPGAGLFAALSFALLPAFTSFSASVDQMYPLVTAASLCAVWRGVLAMGGPKPRQGLLWLGLAGVALGTALFFNMGLIVAVALCGMLAILAARAQRLPARLIVSGAASLGACVLLAPLLLYVVWGYDLWAVFLTSNRLRDALYYNARPYSISLASNLVDFFAFCGLPVLSLWLWQARRTARAEPRSMAMALLAAFMVTLLLLDASGRVRGEAARMWMFLTPPVLVGAGVMWLATWRASRPAAALLLVLQVAQATAFQYFVRVWGY